MYQQKVVNVVGDSSLIEQAGNVFLNRIVKRSNSLKHIENVRLIFKNFTDDQTESAKFCDQLFGETNKIDLILQEIVDADQASSGVLRKLSKASKQPMLCLKKDTIKEWESLSLDQYNALVHFKPIQSVLSTVVRDLIARDRLQTAAILMDVSFGNQTMNIVEDLSFVKIESMTNCERYSIDDWKLRLASLRRLKIENYFVLANTFTINKFLEAFNQQSMFAKHINVYVLTLGGGKIKCISCKHATFHSIRPIMSKLHDYESNENLFQLDTKHRVKLYFYYDLFRLIATTIDRHLKLIKEINSKKQLPTLDRAKCELYLKHQPAEETDFSNLPISNLDLVNSDLTENDPTEFNFRNLLAAQTDQVYGLYGDFKLRVDSIGYGYQDVAMRFERESYLKQKTTRESYAEWSFDPKEGNIFFSAHLLEDEEGGQEVSKDAGSGEAKEAEPKADGGEEKKKESKGEEKKEEAKDEEKKEDAKDEEKKEESKGEEKKEDGGDEAKEDGGGGEEAAAGKPKDNRITIFIVEHPPFIMKRIIDRSKEVALTTTTTTTTTTAAPKVSVYSCVNKRLVKKISYLIDLQEEGEEKEEEPEEEPEEEEKKTEYEYYGFLIDLFELIKEELNAKKTPFPEYKFEEIEVSKDTDKMFYGGDRKADGFSGMVKKINETETDAFALAPLTITASRETLVEFSEPFFQNVGISILMKKPRRKPHFFKFITVLESKVWGCITGAYLFTSILLAIFDQFNPQSYKKKKEAKVMLKTQPTERTDEEDEYEALTTTRVFTFKESLWFCITSLTPQGGGEAPRSLYGRLVAATWWLFGFIVIASYTANLGKYDPDRFFL